MGRVKEKGDAVQQSKSPPKMTDELLNCLEKGRALWTVVFFRMFMQYYLPLSLFSLLRYACLRNYPGTGG